MKCLAVPSSCLMSALAVLAGAAILTGCGAIDLRTQTSTTHAAPGANGNEPSQDEQGRNAATAREEATQELTRQEARVEETSKAGKVSLSDALDGFSPKELQASMVSIYERNHAGAPPEELLAKAAAVTEARRLATEHAAKATNLRPAGARDAATEAAIRADFERRSKGVEIKAVTMVDSQWRANQNELGVVRNRFKSADVVIPVKGTNVCVAIPSIAGQASMGGGQFSEQYSFDVFVQGVAVPCP